MPESSRENPMTMDEEATRIDPQNPTEPRPSELESRLEEVEQKDVTAPGTKPDWPVPTAQAEDEGPLGEGGQLREGDAGGGSGY
jgi:hypothetical protein